MEVEMVAPVEEGNAVAGDDWVCGLECGIWCGAACALCTPNPALFTIGYAAFAYLAYKEHGQC